MRGKGKLTQWDDEKGYGFIEPFDRGERLFVHVSAFAQRSRRPQAGDVVTYTAVTADKGRRKAVDATIAGVPAPRKEKRHNSSTKSATLASGVFFIVVGVVVLARNAPVALLAYYAILSAVTFLAYGFDKDAAQRGDWRTAENTLHLLALFGGWPGGLIARHRFRHKTRKEPFRTVFWLTVAGNLIGLSWVLFADDASSFRAVFAM